MEQEIVLEFSKSHCHFQVSIFIPLFEFSPPLYLMLYYCLLSLRILPIFKSSVDSRPLYPIF